MNPYHNIMEKFWLVTAIATFLYAVYTIGKSGFDSHAVTSLLLAAAAASLFYSRYYLRKKYENRPKDE